MPIRDDLAPVVHTKVQSSLKYLRTWREVVFRTHQFLRAPNTDTNLYLTAGEFAAANLVATGGLYWLAARLADDALIEANAGTTITVLRLMAFLAVFSAAWIFLAFVVPRIWRKAGHPGAAAIPFKRFVESLTYVLAGPALLYVYLVVVIASFVFARIVTVSTANMFWALLAGGLLIIFFTTFLTVWLITVVVKTFYAGGIARRVVLPAIVFLALNGILNYYTGFQPVDSMTREEREALRRLFVLGDFMAVHYQRDQSWSPDIRSNIIGDGAAVFQEMDWRIGVLVHEAQEYGATMRGYNYNVLLYKNEGCVVFAQPQRYEHPTKLSFAMRCPRVIGTQLVYAQDAHGRTATATGGRVVLKAVWDPIPWYVPQSGAGGGVAEVPTPERSIDRVAASADADGAARVRFTADPKVAEQGDHSLVVEWKTDIESSSIVEYAIERQGPFRQAQSPGLSLEHRVRTDPLQANTAYYLRVRSGPAGGHESYVVLRHVMKR